jgi:hypothetical protein
MKTPNLIDVPQDRPSRKEKLEMFKEDHSIWTHGSPKFTGDDRWCALLVNVARTRLAGYGLTLEKTPMEMISGYCRLLDEADLLVTGKTERAAVKTLCELNGIPFV